MEDYEVIYVSVLVIYDMDSPMYCCMFLFKSDKSVFYCSISSHISHKLLQRCVCDFCSACLQPRPVWSCQAESGHTGWGPLLYKCTKSKPATVANNWRQMRQNTRAVSVLNDVWKIQTTMGDKQMRKKPTLCQKQIEMTWLHCRCVEKADMRDYNSESEIRWQCTTKLQAALNIADLESGQESRQMNKGGP